jgi:uncharacterized LabA/DUF88 family protein
MKRINEIDGIILFSGDGDYFRLVKELIELNKQVI